MREEKKKNAGLYAYVVRPRGEEWREKTRDKSGKRLRVLRTLEHIQSLTFSFTSTKWFFKSQFLRIKKKKIIKNTSSTFDLCVKRALHARAFLYRLIIDFLVDTTNTAHAYCIVFSSCVDLMHDVYLKVLIKNENIIK